jgi:hypothetical protein
VATFQPDKNVSDPNSAPGIHIVSGYPYTVELFLLEQFSVDIDELCSDPEAFKEALRRDLIALHDACVAVHPKLWREHLLHEPPGTEAREHYQQYLQSVQPSRLITELAKRRMCHEDDADRLLRLFASGGIRDIIAWRCGVSRYDVCAVRVHRLLAELTAGFPTWAQERSAQFIGALCRAISDTTAPFHIERLLREYSSSDYRLRLSRRLPWSHASAASRHQKRQKEFSAWPPPSPLTRRQQSQRPLEHTDDALTTSFKSQLSLTSGQARHTLRRIVTFGVLGCFSSEEWPQLFHERQVSWLRMIEFGRVDARIVWDKVYMQLQNYSRLLQITTPAKQIARTLFYSFATPRYWSLGKGAATDGRLRQSSRLYDAGLPQANETWIAFTFPIILGKNWRRQQRYRITCIADPNGEIVMGGWLTADNDSEQDLGLALYQAIWHPGAIQWPFRGLPRRIIVPRSLVGEREADLREAAAYLLTDIEIVDRVSLEGKGRLVRARDMLRKEVVRLLSQEQMGRLDPPVLLQHILESLRTHEYAQQRSAAVPRDLRCFGVAMPGFDTPAAGWLLPRSSDVAEVHSSSVRYRGQPYRIDNLDVAPGQQLVVRVFSVAYPHSEPEGRQIGIFVEMDAQGQRGLHYLEPVHQ